MTPRELHRLADFLDLLERHVYKYDALKWASGGFACTEITKFTPKKLRFKLTSGVQNDVEDRTITTHYVMDVPKRFEPKDLQDFMSMCEVEDEKRRERSCNEDGTITDWAKDCPDCV